MLNTAKSLRKKSMFKHEHHRNERHEEYFGNVHVMNVTNVRVARCTVDETRCILPRL